MIPTKFLSSVLSHIATAGSVVLTAFLIQQTVLSSSPDQTESEREKSREEEIVPEEEVKDEPIPDKAPQDIVEDSRREEEAEKSADEKGAPQERSGETEDSGQNPLDGSSPEKIFENAADFVFRGAEEQKSTDSNENQALGEEPLDGGQEPQGQTGPDGDIGEPGPEEDPFSELSGTEGEDDTGVPELDAVQDDDLGGLSDLEEMGVGDLGDLMQSESLTTDQNGDELEDMDEEDPSMAGPENLQIPGMGLEEGEIVDQAEEWDLSDAFGEGDAEETVVGSESTESNGDSSEEGNGIGSKSDGKEGDGPFGTNGNYSWREIVKWVEEALKLSN